MRERGGMRERKNCVKSVPNTKHTKSLSRPHVAKFVTNHSYDGYTHMTQTSMSRCI